MRTIWLYLKSRRSLLRLMLLGFSTAGSLLVLEGAVRVLLPYYHPRAQLALHALPDGMWIGPSNVTVRLANTKSDFDVPVTFNQLGLVDRKELQTAKAGALYAVGDSFTMGWGVLEEERFSSLMERTLGEPVFNVAIPNDLKGYQKLLAYAEAHGPRVTRLVLGICMENDLRNYQVLFKPRGQPRSIARLSNWLLRRSALYLAAAENLQKVRFIRRSLERLGLAVDGEQWVNPIVFDEAALAASRDEVLRLAQGREIMLLLIPSRGLWLKRDPITERRIHDRFAALLQETGLRIVDLRPRFERDGAPLKFYFKADGHWNTHAHRVAAEELAAAILKPAITNAP